MRIYDEDTNSHIDVFLSTSNGKVLLTFIKIAECYAELNASITEIISSNADYCKWVDKNKNSMFTTEELIEDKERFFTQNSDIPGIRYKYFKEFMFKLNTYRKMHTKVVKYR